MSIVLSTNHKKTNCFGSKLQSIPKSTCRKKLQKKIKHLFRTYVSSEVFFACSSLRSLSAAFTSRTSSSFEESKDISFICAIKYLDVKQMVHN